MSSGFEQLKRLIEQPDGKAVRHEIVAKSCRRILANYIAEHKTEVMQVLTMLDNALIQHSPMLMQASACVASPCSTLTRTRCWF